MAPCDSRNAGYRRHRTERYDFHTQPCRRYHTPPPRHSQGLTPAPPRSVPGVLHTQGGRCDQTCAGDGNNAAACRPRRPPGGCGRHDVHTTHSALPRPVRSVLPCPLRNRQCTLRRANAPHLARPSGSGVHAGDRAPPGTARMRRRRLDRPRDHLLGRIPRGSSSAPRHTSHSCGHAQRMLGGPRQYRSISHAPDTTWQNRHRTVHCIADSLRVHQYTGEWRSEAYRIPDR